MIIIVVNRDPNTMMVIIAVGKQQILLSLFKYTFVITITVVIVPNSTLWHTSRTSTEVPASGGLLSCRRIGSIRSHTMDS